MLSFLRIPIHGACVGIGQLVRLSFFSFLLTVDPNIWTIAFFGIVDLLAVLPYYIEVALQEDTVCTTSYLPLR